MSVETTFMPENIFDYVEPKTAEQMHKERREEFSLVEQFGVFPIEPYIKKDDGARVATCGEASPRNVLSLSLNRNPSGSAVWASSQLISEFILTNPFLVKGKRVIELGCGLGLPSISAAEAGAQAVLATDFDSKYLQSLEELLDMNQEIDSRRDWKSRITTKQLDWTKSSSGCYDADFKRFSADVCICADVNYSSDETVIQGLVDTVIASGCSSLVLISREERLGLDEFIKRIKRHFPDWQLDREPICCRKRGIGVGEDQRHSLFIFSK